MQSQSEMDVLEVNKQLLQKLEDMGFPQVRAARALHHSGNASLEAAVYWIIDHENDTDIDRVALIAVNIDIESPKPFHTTEDTQMKEKDLRNRAARNKEEEDKRLEREREKERIRNSKALLEAKQMAEDDERKRNIAMRKAEKEEEKRARDRILQKLAADKAERRQMLGLPPLSHTTIIPSTSAVPEKKNCSYIKSITKTGQLRECLRSLRCNHKDDDAKVKRAFQTLIVYVGNVAKDPDKERFRKIRVENPLFQDRVGRFKEGVEFLELCGFERIEGGKFLFLPRDKDGKLERITINVTTYKQWEKTQLFIRSTYPHIVPGH